jgi:hypothetical protein
MSTTAPSGIDIDRPLLALLQLCAARDVEYVAGRLAALPYESDELDKCMLATEDAIGAYRHIFSAAPYDVALIRKLAASQVEWEADNTDNGWPIAMNDSGGLVEHLALIALRDECTRRLGEETR